MKRKYFVKQACGLVVAGALLPLSLQAADELSDRYINGYLNDPYTNEVAPNTQSVMPHGAEGPIRTDATNAKDRQRVHHQQRSEQQGARVQGSESYNPSAQNSGAQGPVRNDVRTTEDGRYMNQNPQRYESGFQGTELYNPPGQSAGTRGDGGRGVNETKWR